MKYRKKPVVIEAVLFNGTTSWEESPQWLIEATQKHPTQMGALTIVPGSSVAVISTLEGLMTAKSGDLIIRGVKGEIYPCKPDIFTETYEVAT